MIALIIGVILFIAATVLLFVGYDPVESTYKKGLYTGVMYVLMFAILNCMLFYKNHQQFSTSTHYVQTTIKTKIIDNVEIKRDTLITIKLKK